MYVLLAFRCQYLKKTAKSFRIVDGAISTLLTFVLKVCGLYDDFVRILKVHPGSALKSALTIDISPKLANAPRNIPQGK